MRRAVIPVALALSLVACASARRPERPPAFDPPPLTHAPAEHPFDFRADQTVRADVRGRAISVRVVMEKVGDRLTLVGLTPFGARAYTLVQQGLELEAQVHLESELSFPPALVVADIHRTFLVGFPAEAGTARDGERSFVRGGDAFVDTVARGRVSRRRVTPPGPDADVLDIRYEPEGMPLDGEPPERVVVRHTRSGIALTITTTSYRRDPSR